MGDKKKTRKRTDNTFSRKRKEKVTKDQPGQNQVYDKHSTY